MDRKTGRRDGLRAGLFRPSRLPSFLLLSLFFGAAPAHALVWPDVAERVERDLQATDAVAAWLNAQDPRLRRKACEVARALPSPRAVAPLARTLGDPDAEVRAA